MELSETWSVVQGNKWLHHFSQDMDLDSAEADRVLLLDQESENALLL
jgi:hypothetical protein